MWIARWIPFQRNIQLSKQAIALSVRKRTILRRRLQPTAEARQYWISGPIGRNTSCVDVVGREGTVVEL
jgi:hypothetical protein